MRVEMGWREGGRKQADGHDSTVQYTVLVARPKGKGKGGDDQKSREFLPNLGLRGPELYSDCYSSHPQLPVPWSSHGWLWIVDHRALCMKGYLVCA